MTTIRKVRDDTDSLSVFFSSSLVGLLMSLPLTAGAWVPLTASVAPTLAVVGLLGLLGQLLFTWGMGHTTATLGSATTQLVPVLAWVLAIGWLKETVSAMGVVGAILCLGGVLVGVVPWRHSHGPRSLAGTRPDERAGDREHASGL